MDNQQSHHPTQRQPDTTLDSAGISFALAIQLHDLCSCATSGPDTMVLFGDFLELDGALKDCCLQRGLPALRAELGLTMLATFPDPRIEKRKSR